MPSKAARRNRSAMMEDEAGDCEECDKGDDESSESEDIM